MGSAKTNPPGGPLDVQTSTPASAPWRPPSQTSADRASAAQSFGTIVLAAVVDFAFIDGSSGRRAIGDVVDPQIPPVREAHGYSGCRPGPSGGDKLERSRRHRLREC